MNKIIEIALESKYPNIDMEALLDVVNATSNPTVATEVLLGVYEPPRILGVSRVVSDNMVENRTLIEYNKYTDKVAYSYERTEEITCYFPTKEEMDNTTEYNNKLTTNLYGREKADYPFNKKILRTTRDKGNCSSKAWIENKRY